MAVVELIRTNLLWAEAPYLFFSLVALLVVGWCRWRPAAYMVFAGLCFCLFFFRNPTRVCREALVDNSVIVCPADGTVVAIESVPPGEFTQRVAIFLSLFDAHVNWLPVSGMIEQIVYTPGTFGFARRAKSSLLNERNDLIIKTAEGDFVMVSQIAGAVARRIACWVHEGQEVSAGQKFGMIKFGSRVELLLPEDTKIDVAIGQQVYGGQTVIGRLAHR